MITLALETTGDRAAVAVQVGDAPPQEGFVDGARRHAGALLPLATDLLAGAGARLRDVQRVVLADGPGSFTGLRVGAAVAKALVASNGVELRQASTLAARAWMHRPAADGEVTVISSAQRGECYLGRFALTADGIRVVIAPHPVLASAVAPLGAGSAVLVVDLPGEGAGTAGLVAPTGALIIGRPASLPSGLPLLHLLAVQGGTSRVDHPDEWEPTYGRPAEAQARWELAHGRTLPHSPGCAE